ncbi:MAG: type II secretion system F family protein [Aeoliella sp.]
MANESKKNTSPTAAAASAALPLNVVLETLADGLQESTAQRALEQISARLEKGATLDEALVDGDRTIPRYLAGLLRAAIESGNMAEACDGYLNIRESSLRTSNTMRSIMLYPLLLGLAFTALAFLFSIWVIPQFGEMFDEFDLSLPPVTQVVMAGAPYVPWVIVVGMGALAIVLLAPTFFIFAPLAHRVRCTLPVVGRLFMNAGQRQFSQVLGHLLNLRLPMASALTYTGDLVADRNLGRAAYRMATAVERGIPLSESLAGSKHFDRSLPALVRWGEAGSHLGDTLHLAADMFDDRVRQRTLFLHRVAPTIAMVMVAACALSVTLALMIPLVKLIEGLSPL